MRMSECSELLTAPNCPPLLFRDAITNWPARNWSPVHLANILGDNILQCKVSAADPEDSSWETDCLHLHITMRQYSDWLAGNPSDDSPLYHIDGKKYSCYVDYKYMKDMFKDKPHVLKEISWDQFGLHGRDGTDSTLWIGSAGAYTPCHQDTYGFNLVAQLNGRKRWYLFPPSQSQSMYPTRVPYEESSVFSDINIRCPNLKKHPHFKTVHPYVVDLHPGDVLYVPRHWWHFVECLESAISVNTWVPMKEDGVTQCDEAISRLLFSCIHSVLPDTEQDQLPVNTNEQLQSLNVNLDYIRSTILSNMSGNTHSQSCQYFDSFCDTFKGHKVYCLGTVNEETNNMTDSFAEEEPYNKRMKVDKNTTLHRKQSGQCQDLVRIYALEKINFTKFADFLEEEYGSLIDRHQLQMSSEGVSACPDTVSACSGELETSTKSKPIFSDNAPVHDKTLSDDIRSVSGDLLEASNDAIKTSNDDVTIEGSDERLKRSSDDNPLDSISSQNKTEHEVSMRSISESATCSINLSDIVNSILAPEVIQHARNVLLKRILKK